MARGDPLRLPPVPAETGALAAFQAAAAPWWPVLAGIGVAIDWGAALARLCHAGAAHPA